jgi:hypothetical protein
MNMVIHQTISQDADARLYGMVYEEIHIRSFVLFAEKDGLLSIPPLNNMVGIPRDYNSSDAGHIFNRANQGITFMLGKRKTQKARFFSHLDRLSEPATQEASYFPIEGAASYG